MTLRSIINNYDEVLRKGREELEAVQTEHDQVQAKMNKIEEEYRLVLHEQEVNKAIRDEWDSKVKVKLYFLIY